MNPTEDQNSPTNQPNPDGPAPVPPTDNTQNSFPSNQYPSQPTTPTPDYQPAVDPSASSAPAPASVPGQFQPNQPTGFPQAPTAPTSSQPQVYGAPMQSPQAYQAPPSGNKSKLGIIIGASVAGFLLLAGLAVVLVVLLSGPSKTDYRKASILQEGAVLSYGDMGSEYVSLPASSTQLDSTVDNLKKSRDKFNSAMNELKDAKAVKNDKEVREAYNNVLNQKYKLDLYLDSSIEAYDKVYRLTDEADLESVASISDLNREYNIVLDAIKKADLKQKVNLDYTNALASDMKRVLSIAPDIRYDPSLLNEYEDLTDHMGKLDREYRANLSKLRKDAESMRGPIDKLSDVLNKKVNQK